PWRQAARGRRGVEGRGNDLLYELAHAETRDVGYLFCSTNAPWTEHLSRPPGGLHMDQEMTRKPGPNTPIPADEAPRTATAGPPGSASEVGSGAVDSRDAL